MKKFFLANVFILITLAACQAAAPTTIFPDSRFPPTITPGGPPTPIVPTIPRPTPAPAPTATIHIIPTELVVVTHDSFAVSDDVLAEFQNANHVKVEVLKSGDAGAALNKAILAGEANPLGDVFFGVDNTFLSRALNANLFEPYRAQGLDNIPADYQRAPESRLTPIDYGYVCINYDKAWFLEKKLAPPTTLQDLTKAEYKGLLAVENPATSSPGLAFLLASISQFGADRYLDFWKALRANDVAISEGWEDAYYNKSTWSGNGDRPLVVSYATSPAAEVFFSDGKLTEPPTGNVLGDGACFRQIEFAGIFKNARHPDMARRFIDFMLSKNFQEDIPTQMFVYPVNPNAQLPDFYKFAEKPNVPAQLDAALIDANREKWIKEWTQAVLR